MRYLIISIIILLSISCDKEEQQIVDKVYYNLKIKRIVFFDSRLNDTTFRVVPKYNGDNLIELEEDGATFTPDGKFHNQVVESNNSFKFILDEARQDNSSPYISVIFNFSNGQLDSINYNDALFYANNIEKRVYEYDDNKLTKEIETDKLTGESNITTIYDSLIYDNEGNIKSYVLENFKFNIKYKEEYSYFEDKEWNMSGFNLFLLNGRLGLYGDSRYYLPLFFKNIKFWNNKSSGKLVKALKRSGYSIVDGVKTEYFYEEEIQYKFDSIGRVVSFPISGFETAFIEYYD